MQVSDSSDNRLLRKNENTLVVCGAGVIMFGVWSVVKAAMLFVLNISVINSKINESGGGILGLVIFIIVMAIIVGIDLWLRLYIGRRAIDEGKNGNRRRYYSAVIILIFFYILGIGLSVFDLVHPAGDGLVLESKPEQMVSVLVDITSVYVMILLAKSTRSVRNARKGR